ncbi:MAG: hypothetical protein H6619_00945 [Deltaproteobacteria bacterium]|nr:hypothetical protein [Deltaproteobacteria bacterium]
MLEKKLIFVILTSVLALFCEQASAQDMDLLLKKLEAMEARINDLETQLKSKNDAQSSSSKVAFNKSTKPNTTSSNIDEDLFKPNTINTQSASEAIQKRKAELGQFGITYRSDGYAVDSLRFGAYGESMFGRIDSGDGWKNGFDANKVVLLGTYQVTEDIIFNTEIEFEHGGIAAEEDDKLNGAIEVEQLFIDFRSNEHFTWRSPGVDVVPVGYINLFHEPTQYYSSNRPEIYDGLIPSTWFAPSTGFYGKIIDGLNYQFQISSGLEDVGTAAEEEGGSVPSDSYEAGISAGDGLRHARAPIGDHTQVGEDLAYAVRLSYDPEFIPGLSGSTSFYYTDDITPRGAYGTNLNGTTRTLGRSNLSIFDTELRYRIPSTGLELRAEYAQTNFGDTDNLRANNDGDPTNNVGSHMRGYSLEAAYHWQLYPNAVESWEIVPFYRFSDINLQSGGVNGSDANTPSGEFDRRFHTIGAAIFPTPKIVLKLDYQFIEDEDPTTADEKALLGAVGFFF